MKKILCFFILLSSFTLNIQAESYIVFTGDGDIVEEKNAHDVQSVASISKIMTAIIAIEQLDLKKIITVNEEMLQTHGSLVYLEINQKVSVETLIYGLILRSGNECARILSILTYGSEKKFVKEMNNKAKEIGMLETVFHNASGLDDEDEGNLSNAYDMAILMRYALKNKTFQKITSSKYYRNELGNTWKNKNRLLFEFPFCNGGKTGFTKLAKRTLVTSAKNKDTQSIVVTLRTENDFNFHKEKHMELFEKYVAYPFMKKGTYKYKGYQFDVNETIYITFKKDYSDSIEVFMNCEKKQCTLEVKKNENIQMYTFDAFYKRSKKWWKL